MRKILILFPIALTLLLLINIPIVSLGIMVVMEDNQYKKTNYHYSSADPIGFSVWSRKGFQDVLDQFGEYKKRHSSDTILYRNFTKQYWKAWRWRDYLFDKRYQLPFKELPADAKRVSRGME